MSAQQYYQQQGQGYGGPGYPAPYPQYPQPVSEDGELMNRFSAGHKQTC